MNRDTTLYGLGAIGLGAVGLVVGDFALQWQPVPPDVPARAALAYLAAGLLVAGGVATLLRPREGVLALGVFYGLWALVLHGPRVAANPLDVATWNGVAEITALSAGGLAAWAAMTDRPAAQRAARIAFGLAGLVFGTAHFVYARFTASMVPAFYPAPLFWAYATGAGHFAAGLAFVSGVQARLAATALSAMFAVFVITLHLPRVIAAPGVRIEWTMLMVALSLTGAAWALRGSLTRR